MVKNDVATRQLFAQRKKIDSDDDAARRIGRLLSTLIWGGSKKRKNTHEDVEQCGERERGFVRENVYGRTEANTHKHTRFCIYFLFIFCVFFRTAPRSGETHGYVYIPGRKKKLRYNVHMRSNRNGITKCIHICIYGLWVPSRRLIAIAQQYSIATTLASAQY